MIRSNLKPDIQISLRQSSKVPHQPDRYLDFLIRDGDPIELDENNEDPVTYMDAMQRTDSKKWLEVMKFKIESMKINNMWTLVDPPEGIKPIRCKWVFKRKEGTDEKLRPIKLV